MIEFQLSYIKSWKMMLWKCYTQYVSKFGKLNSGHRTSKVMLKILQARFQRYMDHELPDVQAGFRKGRGKRDQIASILWIIEKARKFQKNIYFCFIDYAKAFDCVDHNKLWNILQKMWIPDYLTCLWETCRQVRKQQLELDMKQQIGKGVHQGCILSRCLFNLYAEYIFHWAGRSTSLNQDCQEKCQ